MKNAERGTENAADGMQIAEARSGKTGGICGRGGGAVSRRCVVRTAWAKLRSRRATGRCSAGIGCERGAHDPLGGKRVHPQA
jgi:hypothetical protein